MGSLMDDQAQKDLQLEDRAIQTRATEMELKSLKQDLLAEQEKIRLANAANERLAAELRTKQEEVESELSQRVERIIEKERSDYKS